MRSYINLAVLVLAASIISPAMSAPGQPISYYKPPKPEYECIPIMLLAMPLIFMPVPEDKNLDRTGLQPRREGPTPGHLPVQTQFLNLVLWHTGRTSVFRCCWPCH
jgi:hypothetical protein